MWCVLVISKMDEKSVVWFDYGTAHATLEAAHDYKDVWFHVLRSQQ